MSRYFMIQSWVGSHENEPDYNGQQAGERNVRSSEVVPLFDKHGNANTKYFSDEAIAARNKPQSKKKATRSVAEKILPQNVRYENLCNLMSELESERSTMTDEDYYQYHAILQAKIDRQWQLLSKAAGWEDKDCAQHSPLSSSPIQSKKHVQIGTNRVNKGSNSAKVDLIKFLTGSFVCFVAVMFMKTFM